MHEVHCLEGVTAGYLGDGVWLYGTDGELTGFSSMRSRALGTGLTGLPWHTLAHVLPPPFTPGKSFKPMFGFPHNEMRTVVMITESCRAQYNYNKESWKPSEPNSASLSLYLSSSLGNSDLKHLGC